MTTQQLNFTTEEMQVLREMLAERIEAKRAVAAASAAAEEEKRKKEQAHDEAMKKHVENLLASGMMQSVRASEEAIRRAQSPELAKSLDAINRRRW